MTKRLTTAYVDKKFSRWIRDRDPICVRCYKAPSQDCSHYWARGRSGTRFDDENCVGLCRACHGLWEMRKNHEYMDHMVTRLGRKRYEELERRARTFKSRRIAVEEAMAWLSFR